MRGPVIPPVGLQTLQLPSHLCCGGSEGFPLCLVAQVTSQVAAEAAGNQASNKQGNTQRGGSSLLCSTSFFLLFFQCPISTGGREQESVPCCHQWLERRRNRMMWGCEGHSV